MLKFFFTGGALALSLTLPALSPAWANDITITDAYARSASPTAMSGAAFLVLTNSGTSDDRLVAASSDAAARVELHTHREDANGVMRMMEVEEGFALPAGGSHVLARGGDHIMFMGLAAPWAQGDVLTVTLRFERAGEMTVEIPVDLERKPMPGHANHGQMKHGN